MRIEMHSVRQIRVVKALAQHRHFGRAARALGVSQPNLTRSLKQIEDGLGVPLFERQGVTPTMFGEIVLRHGEKAMADFEELIREIMLARGLEIGELRLVAGPYPADISGDRAVGLLLKKHPKLFVEIRSANWDAAVGEVMSGAADLAFAETGAAAAVPELQIEVVRKSRLAFYCAADHPLAHNREIALDDLVQYPWAGPSLPGRIGTILPKVDLPFAIFE
jgi:DNA-binding transcriptional LysR family regulator